MKKIVKHNDMKDQSIQLEITEAQIKWDSIP